MAVVRARACLCAQRRPTSFVVGLGYRNKIKTNCTLGVAFTWTRNLMTDSHDDVRVIPASSTETGPTEGTSTYSIQQIRTFKCSLHQPKRGCNDSLPVTRRSGRHRHGSGRVKLSMGTGIPGSAREFLCCQYHRRDINFPPL